MREGEIWEYKAPDHPKSYRYFVSEWSNGRGTLQGIDKGCIDDIPFPYDEETRKLQTRGWRLSEDHTADVAIKPHDLVKCPECDTSFILKDHYLCEECRYATSA